MLFRRAIKGQKKRLQIMNLFFSFVVSYVLGDRQSLSDLNLVYSIPSRV
jgi:hypothetical protein